MCEFEETLVAWLDGELPADEATLVERHLRHCRECSGRITAYETVSGEVASYCESALAASGAQPRRWSMWARVGAVAAGLLVLSILPYSRHERMVRRAVPQTSPPAIAFAPAPAAVRTVRPKIIRKAADARLHPVARVAPARVPNITPPFPEIEIAIPAEALFPPGAVPEGFQFVAAIGIGADGSAQSLRLRPY